MTQGVPLPAPAVAAVVHESIRFLAQLSAYNHWAYDVLRPFLQGDICDVGCGNGNFLQYVLHHPRVVGLDIHAPTLNDAQARFRQHANVELVQANVYDCPSEVVPARSFDTVVCMRLLDSLPDDVGALRRMAALCRAEGQVVIIGSAGRWAYGKLDRTVGHLRRYSRGTMRKSFAAAGMDVVFSRYMNLPGYFGWLTCSRILKRTRVPEGGARLTENLVPVLEAIERLIPPPFGQSLVMVGRPRR